MRKREALHKVAYFFTRNYYKLVLRKYGYKTNIAPHMNEPFIVMSNHLSMLDVQLVAQAFPQHTYFVCGEHILRGKNGKAIHFLHDPITTYMGGSKLGAVAEMLRRIKSGNNILLFPEGARTYNGITKPITTSTAKLVKKAKCALITYRMRGGYFADPRWAHHRRVGHMEGEIVGIYSSQQLAGMSLQEITDCINADIYENAYDTQERNPLPYRGEGLAEGLENYLILCPKCGTYDPFQTKGDRFTCKCCGLTGIYDEYGFLQGEEVPFRRIDEWDNWLVPQFDSDMSKRSNDELLFTETNIHLDEVLPGYKTIDHGTETVKVYKDRMIFGSKEFLYSDISVMSLLFIGKTLLFTHKGTYYSMGGDEFYARKIDLLYKLSNKTAPFLDSDNV